MSKVMYACFCLIVTLISIPTIVYSQEFREKKGKVKIPSGKPLPGATIINRSSRNPETKDQIRTTTNRTGNFSILAKLGDTIEIAFIGLETTKLSVTNFENVEIFLASSNELSEVVVTAGGGVSPRSTWVGAKIGYNFDGIPDDNEFVGAAKISINPLKKNFSNSPSAPYISIIGNFADFISNASKDTVQKKINSLTLSTQGLGIGLGATWEFPIRIGDHKENTLFFRPYMTSGYRLNTFTKVGKDSSTINLSQFRNTIGIEFEGLTFNNGGVVNISFEAAVSLFDPGKYELIFNERKHSVKTFEGTIILPISSLIGFMVDATFAKDSKPVFLIGVVFKSK